MIIILLILCVFIGVILAGVMAPIALVHDRKILSEIRNEVDGFNGDDNERRMLKRRLIDLRAKIVADKVAMTTADQLISLL